MRSDALPRACEEVPTSPTWSGLVNQGPKRGTEMSWRDADYDGPVLFDQPPPPVSLDLLKARHSYTSRSAADLLANQPKAMRHGLLQKFGMGFSASLSLNVTPQSLQVFCCGYVQCSLIASIWAQLATRASRYG